MTTKEVGKVIVLGIIFIFVCISFFISKGEYQIVDNKCTYVQHYGLIDKDIMKKDNIKYDLNWYNVILGASTFKGVVIPVTLFGWYLFEPVNPPCSKYDELMVRKNK